MKLVFNKIPINDNFNPEEDGWTPLKEPKNMLISLLLSLPIGITAAFAVYLLVNWLQISHSFNFGMSLSFLLALFILIPLHEFFHAIFFPERVSSKNIIIGFIPKSFAFFAFYDQEMLRNRFLLVLIAPFILLSIFPVILMKVTTIHLDFLVEITIINSLLSCVDLLGMIFIISQVPSKALVRNKGIHSYWINSRT
jgi:hypothetical protein